MKITLHIGSNEIKLVAGKKGVVKTWLSKRMETGIVQDGRVVNPEKAGEIINNMFVTHKLPRNGVIVSISGLPYTYRVIDLPPLKENDVQEAIIHSLQGETTIPVEELYITWAPLEESYDGVNYFILAVDRELIDSVIETIRAAGIKDWVMDLEPLAVARLASEGDAIVACLDHNKIDIVLTSGGLIREIHSTGIDYDENDITDYYDQFAGELMKLISFYQNSAGQGEDLTDLPIIITGELVSQISGEASKSTQDEAITEQISQLTGHPTSVMQFPLSFALGFTPHAFVTNAGLFLKDVKKKSQTYRHQAPFHDVNIDILSGRFRSKPALVPVWMAVVPVTLFIAAMAGWTVNAAYTDNSVKTANLQDEVSRLNAQIILMDKEESRQQELQQQLEKTQRALETAKSNHEALLGGKGEHVTGVSIVRNNLPEGTYLTSIAISNETIRITGITDNLYKVITYLKVLKAAGTTPEINELGGDIEGGFTFRMTLGYAGMEVSI